jgi:polyhydroxyalkanoate synthase
VLAASGHIAGMINPPSKGKGSHWTNETDGAAFETPEAWLAGAQKHDGSWWADWAKWLEARSGRKTTAMTVGSAAHPPIGDAPGTYVLEK